MILDGAREQYANQLRQLDRPALLKEIEQLQKLLLRFVAQIDPLLAAIQEVRRRGLRTRRVRLNLLGFWAAWA